jgi:hypothetical protein
MRPEFKPILSAMLRDIDKLIGNRGVVFELIEVREFCGKLLTPYRLRNIIPRPVTYEVGTAEEPALEVIEDVVNRRLSDRILRRVEAAQAESARVSGVRPSDMRPAFKPIFDSMMRDIDALIAGRPIIFAVLEPTEYRDQLFMNFSLRNAIPQPVDVDVGGRDGKPFFVTIPDRLDKALEDAILQRVNEAQAESAKLAGVPYRIPPF